MEGGALSDSRLKELEKNYILFGHVTSHVEGHANPKLLGEKGGRGFPYLVYLDGDGNVIHKLGYAWLTIEGLIQTGWAFDTHSKLEPAITGGTAQPDAAFTMAQLILGKADLAKTRKAMAPFKLTEPQQKRWTMLEKHFEFAEILGQVQKKALPAAKAGETMAGWIGTEKEPTSGDNLMPFWQLVMAHAEAAKNAALFEQSMGKLKPLYQERFGKHPRLAQFFAKWEATLTQLKAAAKEKEGGSEDGGEGEGGDGMGG